MLKYFTCGKCNELKPESEFYEHNSKLRQPCINCKREYARKWRANNPQYHKDWRQKNAGYDADWMRKRRQRDVLPEDELF